MKWIQVVSRCVAWLKKFKSKIIVFLYFNEKHFFFPETKKKIVIIFKTGHFNIF